MMPRSSSRPLRRAGFMGSAPPAFSATPAAVLPRMLPTLLPFASAVASASDVRAALQHVADTLSESYNMSASMALHSPDMISVGVNFEAEKNSLVCNCSVLATL